MGIGSAMGGFAQGLFGSPDDGIEGKTKKKVDLSGGFMSALTQGMEKYLETPNKQPHTVGAFTGNSPSTVGGRELTTDDANYASTFGVSDDEIPQITGRNVTMEGLHPDIGKYAYPIMNKHKLTIVDAFRKTQGNGAKNSQHLHGNAMDVAWSHIPDDKRGAIIQEFKDSGFTGFGVGPTSLHIDRRKSPASWSYYGGTATGGGKMPKYARGVL